MSVYPSPNRNSRGFNPSDFTKANSGSLTLAEAYNYFLKLSGGSISGSLSVAGNITGTIATASQPYITNLGTLNGLNITGSLTLNGISVSDFSTITLPDYCKTITPGTATAGKVLVIDNSSNITGIGTLSATSLTATSLNGTLQTATQTNITKVGSLNGLTINNSDTNTSGGTLVLTLAHSLSSGTPGINIGTGIDFQTLNSSSSMVSYARIYVGSVSITAGAQIGSFIFKPYYNGGSMNGMTLTPTSASAATLTVNTVSATTLTGTISTPAQPSITSLWTLTTLTVGTTL